MPPSPPGRPLRERRITCTHCNSISYILFASFSHERRFLLDLSIIFFLLRFIKGISAVQNGAESFFQITCPNSKYNLKLPLTISLIVVQHNGDGNQKQTHRYSRIENVGVADPGGFSLKKPSPIRIDGFIRIVRRMCIVINMDSFH